MVAKAAGNSFVLLDPGDGIGKWITRKSTRSLGLLSKLMIRLCSLPAFQRLNYDIAKRNG